MIVSTPISVVQSGTQESILKVASYMKRVKIMKALIDADIFQWELGSLTDDEYKPVGWPIVQNMVQAKIDRIMEATGASEYQLYVTSEDKSNFRFDVATIQPYKGNRSGSEKPHWYTQIRNLLVDQRGAIECFGQEADDAMSIAQWEDYRDMLAFNEKAMEEVEPVLNVRENLRTVICSRDKDLNMVPGYHYTWSAGGQKERPMWFQTELGGLQCFYKQCLTGDSTDHILGLFGVGKSSTLLKKIDELEDELSMYEFVLEQYQKRFGSYAEQFLIENARLLWMRSKEHELWLPPKKVK